MGFCLLVLLFLNNLDIIHARLFCNGNVNTVALLHRCRLPYSIHVYVLCKYVCYHMVYLISLALLYTLIYLVWLFEIPWKYTWRELFSL